MYEFLILKGEKHFQHLSVKYLLEWSWISKLLSEVSKIKMTLNDFLSTNELVWKKVTISAFWGIIDRALKGLFCCCPLSFGLHWVPKKTPIFDELNRFHPLDGNGLNHARRPIQISRRRPRGIGKPLLRRTCGYCQVTRLVKLSLRRAIT